MGFSHRCYRLVLILIGLLREMDPRFNDVPPGFEVEKQNGYENCPNIPVV